MEGEANLRKQLAERVDLLTQRRLLLVLTLPQPARDTNSCLGFLQHRAHRRGSQAHRRLHVRLDFTDLGAHARGHNHADGGAVSHGCALSTWAVGSSKSEKDLDATPRRR